MPQANTISVLDGKATPVAHVFAPSKTGAASEFTNANSLTLAGRERVTVTVREPSGSTAGKVSIKLVVPVEKTDASNNTEVSHQALANLDFVLPVKGSLAERTDLLALMASLLANVDIKAIVKNVEPAF